MVQHLVRFEVLATGRISRNGGLYGQGERKRRLPALGRGKISSGAVQPPVPVRERGGWIPTALFAATCYAGTHIAASILPLLSSAKQGREKGLGGDAGEREREGDGSRASGRENGDGGGANGGVNGTVAARTGK